MTNDQLISQYDCTKIEKLSRKINRLKSAEKLHERHLYDLDEMNAKVDRIINRVCKILVNELVEMIKSSNFFSKENKSTTLTENRRVFMILK